jgi:hypothetical protein
MKFNDAINSLIYDKKFRSYFIKSLKKISKVMDFRIYIPRKDPFQIIIMQDTFNKRTDHTIYEKYFKGRVAAIVFPNLDRTALLVVPEPYQNRKYGHIAEFIRNAPSQQIHKVLILLAQTVKEHGPEYPWISTHGHGVPWLHIRLDSIPRYLEWVET